MQGETLDNLAEGVAVFGPDGRVRLANPAFAPLWRLPSDVVARKLHVSATSRVWCGALAVRQPEWAPLLAPPSPGFGDKPRTDSRAQAELQERRACSTMPSSLCPTAQMMVTFVDVTDSCEGRAGADSTATRRCEAADRLKNAFIQHVSYELRSPLTNIIGFTRTARRLPTAGPLIATPARIYRLHPASSSAVLLDGRQRYPRPRHRRCRHHGARDLGEVRVGRARVAAAAEVVSRPAGRAFDQAGARYRARAGQLRTATRTRIRQILYNLLSNAVSFATAGSHASRSPAAAPAPVVEFSVHDDGPGMAARNPRHGVPAASSRVSSGGPRRGAGLGLSIVKSFVEHCMAAPCASRRERGPAPRSSACSFRPFEASAPRLNNLDGRLRSRTVPAGRSRNGAARQRSCAGLAPGRCAGAVRRSRRRQDRRWPGRWSAPMPAIPISKCRARPSRSCSPMTAACLSPISTSTVSARPSNSTSFDLDEALAEGAAVIEWPDRADDRLPADSGFGCAFT